MFLTRVLNTSDANMFVINLLFTAIISFCSDIIHSFIAATESGLFTLVYFISSHLLTKISY